MRILVCGGRDFKDKNLLFKTLSDVFQESDTLIQGGARGADFMSGSWAIKNNINQVVFEADWDRYGKAAGYRRNKQMLEEGKPNLVLAFGGGKGTAMMIKIAKEAGVEVIEV